MIRIKVEKTPFRNRRRVVLEDSGLSFAIEMDVKDIQVMHEELGKDCWELGIESCRCWDDGRDQGRVEGRSI